MKTILKTSIYLGTLVFVLLGILWLLYIIFPKEEFPERLNIINLWPTLVMFIIASIFYFSGKNLIKK